MAVNEGIGAMLIDEAYEFSAPRFFNFVNGESEEEIREAELWFDSALSYAPSPCMPRIEASRSVMIENLCDFREHQEQKTSESSNSITTNCPPEAGSKEPDACKSEAKEQSRRSLANVVSSGKMICQKEEQGGICVQESGSVVVEDAPLLKVAVTADKCAKTYTPKPSTAPQNGDLLAGSKKQSMAKQREALCRNSSALKPKSLLSSGAKPKIQPSVKRETHVKNPVGTPSLAQENQAIKRQRLEGGRSRQILNPKPQTLSHKSKLRHTGVNSISCSSSSVNDANEGRKIYVREPAAPFVSMAEMMKRFQSSTRELSLSYSYSVSHDAAASVLQRPKPTLTRPKEPDFETAQRVRSTRIKSAAELEEEMMAKIPKFKARPLNKKILEAPTLPALPRSTPQPPLFQEFHLETMERANQTAERASVASTETSRQNNQWKPRLTEPRSPLLQTSLRARPPRVKSSLELEQELEKAPKFKARPLNRKIFESKGEWGLFCNTKKEVTKPQEFHFATNERIPAPAAVVDMFDKLSLDSERRHEPILRNTKPNPFRLKTEERGAEKEKKFITEVMQKLWEEEQARIPKANPYPYTTDYPVIPPKPEPKQCTRPEPFELESLVRHEEEMRREMEARRRKEREEAQMRIFKAQPILKEDPIPVPEKVRKPLTEVQEFNQHVDHRAVERAEFDKKVKEKEMMYKRHREQSEAARMMEEEKALKQLRRTMVPHARALPNFDHPFHPQKSTKEATKAKSPKFRVQERTEKRMHRLISATASAATNMR